jgi:hypothetical protein
VDLNVQLQIRLSSVDIAKGSSEYFVRVL